MGRIGRIVYVAAAPDFAAILTDGPRFDLRCADVVAAGDPTVRVEGPVAHDDALGPFRGYAAGARRA